jgi:hypothetical protein
MQQQYIQTVGTFECIVEKPEAGWFGESREKGTPFARIPLKVVEGPCAGQRIVWSGWLSEGACDGTSESLATVFGFDGDWDALHAGKITFTGQRCSVTTEAETYQGKQRIKAKWLNAVGGGGPKPMEESKVKSLLSKLTPRSKAVAKAAKAAAGVTTAPATSEPAPTAAPDDDVPF